MSVLARSACQPAWDMVEGSRMVFLIMALQSLMRLLYEYFLRARVPVSVANHSFSEKNFTDKITLLWLC
jgi:hypothetical protein